jgi:uncharacterized membrane protein (DUF485 family)
MNSPLPEPIDVHSETFLRRLMRGQLKLSIACAAVFLSALFGLPLLNYFFPEFMATRVFGFTLTWFILGVLFFPFVWVISYFFIKWSIALEETETNEVEKHQNPNTKHQINTNPQTPNASASALLLMFGAWSFSGVWCLVFGV